MTTTYSNPNETVKRPDGTRTAHAKATSRERRSIRNTYTLNGGRF
jgi:hypothetical protein